VINLLSLSDIHGVSAQCCHATMENRTLAVSSLLKEQDHKLVSWIRNEKSRWSSPGETTKQVIIYVKLYNKFCHPKYKEVDHKEKKIP